MRQFYYCVIVDQPDAGWDRGQTNSITHWWFVDDGYRRSLGVQEDALQLDCWHGNRDAFQRLTVVNLSALQLITLPNMVADRAGTACWQYRFAIAFSRKYTDSGSDRKLQSRDDPHAANAVAILRSQHRQCRSSLWRSRMIRQRPGYAGRHRQLQLNLRRCPIVTIAENRQNVCFTLRKCRKMAN